MTTPFDIQTRDMGDVTILALSGTLNAETGAKLEQAFEAAFERQRHRLIIDFADLGYVSSAGISCFLVALKRIERMRGALRFAAMSPKNRRIFELLGFDTLFQTFDTREQAVESFQASIR